MQGTHSLAPTTPTIGPANSSLLQSTSALTSPFFASRELPSVSTPLELRRGRIKRQRCVQVDKLQKQVAEQRQEGGKLLAEVSRLRAEGGQAAQRGAREVARLKWELETERATCRELTENNQSFIAKVATLQERCSSLEDARREVVGLRGKLAEMAKGRAESMTIAATANAEAELLRVQVKELSDALSGTLRHAQAHEAELAGEREALRVKTEELEQQQARLQVTSPPRQHDSAIGSGFEDRDKGKLHQNSRGGGAYPDRSCYTGPLALCRMIWRQSRRRAC